MLHGVVHLRLDTEILYVIHSVTHYRNQALINLPKPRTVQCKILNWTCDMVKMDAFPQQDKALVKKTHLIHLGFGDKFLM